jgi:imidazolonepropionase-like amidohydrolase
MSKAGYSLRKVLQLATYGTAVYIGKSNEFGSIARGKKADFILVEGDPVQNISAYPQYRWVVKNGVLYDAGKLYQAVSIKA